MLLLAEGQCIVGIASCPDGRSQDPPGHLGLAGPDLELDGDGRFYIDFSGPGGHRSTGSGPMLTRWFSRARGQRREISWGPAADSRKPFQVPGKAWKTHLHTPSVRYMDELSDSAQIALFFFPVFIPPSEPPPPHTHTSSASTQVAVSCVRGPRPLKRSSGRFPQRSRPALLMQMCNRTLKLKKGKKNK